MAPKTSKALTTGKPASLAAPAFLKPSARGNENTRSQDLAMPFIKVGQSLTPEVKEGKAEEGSFIHSVSKEDLGNSISVVVVTHQVRRQGWNPQGEGGGKFCESLDLLNGTAMGEEGGGLDAADKPCQLCSKCVKKDWTKVKGKNKPPLCGEVGFLLVKPVGKKDLAVMALGKTEFPAYKSIVSLLNARQHPETGAAVDAFATVLKLTTTEKKAKQGTVENSWFVIQAEVEGWASEEDYLQAEAFYEGFGKKFGKTMIAEQE